MGRISFRKVHATDKEWIQNIIRSEWGSDVIIVHNTVFKPIELNGFIAEEDDEDVGLITFVINGNACEIITLNSFKESKGIGTGLIKMVKDEALRKGCSRLWLITTNDNLEAINFYEKHGFKLERVFPGAVNQSRKIKPEIPETAENGIAITDELEFRMELKQNFQN